MANEHTYGQRHTHIKDNWLLSNGLALTVLRHSDRKTHTQSLTIDKCPPLSSRVQNSGMSFDVIEKIRKNR